MKKLLALCTPLGLLIRTIYAVCFQWVDKLPVFVTYFIMICSILFMLIGLAYYGWCLGKRKNPFDFRNG